MSVGTRIGPLGKELTEPSPATHCPRCVARGLPEHFGSSPVCAFGPNPDAPFSRQNWACATIDALREIAYEENAWAGAAFRWNDRSVAIVNADPGWFNMDGDQPDPRGGYVVFLYYKDRGEVEHAFILGDKRWSEVVPWSHLTLGQAEVVLGRYEALERRREENARRART